MLKSETLGCDGAERSVIGQLRENGVFVLKHDWLADENLKLIGLGAFCGRNSREKQNRNEMCQIKTKLEQVLTSQNLRETLVRKTLTLK